MYIYTLESSLFLGQKRHVILDFVTSFDWVEQFVNKDNNYPKEKKWQVVNLTS